MLKFSALPSSRSGKVVNFLGLDSGPFCWSLAGPDAMTGQLVAAESSRSASLRYPGQNCSMSARSHGLLATRYTLHAGEGGAGATATRRLTGLFARSTALSILGEEFTLIGGGDRYCLVTRSADTVGSISIFNPGAGPREWRGTLEFQQRFGVAAQAFVFWVAVNKIIQNHNSSSA